LRDYAAAPPVEKEGKGRPSTDSLTMPRAKKGFDKFLAMCDVSANNWDPDRQQQAILLGFSDSTKMAGK
jgi:hypothetical protein